MDLAAAAAGISAAHKSVGLMEQLADVGKSNPASSGVARARAGYILSDASTDSFLTRPPCNGWDRSYPALPPRPRRPRRTASAPAAPGGFRAGRGPVEPGPQALQLRTAGQAGPAGPGCCHA